MGIETAITEGLVANLAAVGVKIAQCCTAVGAGLVGILPAGVSRWIAGVLHQYDLASASGSFHRS
jgi:hypothetical protein